LHIVEPLVGLAHPRQHRSCDPVERFAALATVRLAAVEALAAFLVLAMEDDVSVAAQAALAVLADRLRSAGDDDFRPAGLGFLPHHGSKSYAL
jgi:hypothetical protein